MFGNIVAIVLQCCRLSLYFTYTFASWKRHMPCDDVFVMMLRQIINPNIFTHGRYFTTAQTN